MMDPCARAALGLGRRGCGLAASSLPRWMSSRYLASSSRRFVRFPGSCAARREGG